MKYLHWVSRLAVLLVLGTGAGAPVRADFPLPILNPVTKTISVPADIDPAELDRFRVLDDLSIEVRLSGGNLVPGRLLNKLRSDFARQRKLFLMSGDIEPRHAQALRGLERVEIWYRASGEIDQDTINRLHDFGPVRKVVEVPGEFRPASLARLTRLGNSAVAVAVGERLSGELLDALAALPKVRKYLLFGPASDAAAVFQASELSQVELIVPTKSNRVADSLLRLLSRLRGIKVTFVVDGGFTLAEARKLAQVEELGIKVRLDNPPRLIPGLVGLLQRLRPP